MGDSLGEQWPLVSSMPQLSATEIVDALSKWEGMGDTLALFQEALKEERSAYVHMESLECTSMIAFSHDSHLCFLAVRDLVHFIKLGIRKIKWTPGGF